MNENATEKSLNWDAHYVGISSLRKRQHRANCITLDEVALEATRLLLAYVPTTIEDQIPVFTEWVVSGSSWNTKSQKKNFLSKRKGC
jgi:hypothetical protein